MMAKDRPEYVYNKIYIVASHVAQYDSLVADHMQFNADGLITIQTR